MNGIQIIINYEEVVRRLYGRLKEADEKKLKVTVTPKSAIWAYLGLMVHDCEKEVQRDTARATLGLLCPDLTQAIYSREIADNLFAIKKDFPELLDFSAAPEPMHVNDQTAYFSVRLTVKGKAFVAIDKVSETERGEQS